MTQEPAIIAQHRAAIRQSPCVDQLSILPWK
jgi:hypothetical protein